VEKRRVQTRTLVQDLIAEPIPLDGNNSIVQYLKRILRHFTGAKIMQSCFDENPKRGIPEVPDLTKNYRLEYNSVSQQIEWTEIL